MNLTEQIRSIVNIGERRDALRGVMTSLADAGKLFLTPILMLEEPYRTACLEGLDGTVTEGTIPRPQSQPEIELPPVRLCSVRKDGEAALHYQPTVGIRRKRQVSVPILGTTKMRTESRWDDLGPDATLPARQARLLLARHGFPMVSEPTIVEYAWIKSEASKPGADDYIVALLAEIDSAVGAKTAPASKKATSTQASL